MFALMRLIGMLVMLWAVLPMMSSMVTMIPAVDGPSSALAPIDEMVQGVMGSMMKMMTYVGYAGVVLFAMQAVLELTWAGMIGVGIRNRASEGKPTDMSTPDRTFTEVQRRVLGLQPTTAVTAGHDPILEAKIQESLQYDPDLQNADRIIGDIEELFHLPRTVPTRETVAKRTMAQFDRVMRRLKDVEDEPSQDSGE